MKTLPVTLVLYCMAASMLSTDLRANDTRVAANYEPQSLLGAGGRMYHHAQEYGHGNGALTCRATGTTGTATATFPFTVPDAQRLKFVGFTGKRTSTAPQMELRVKKSCMKWTEVSATTTTLEASAPGTDAQGFFNTFLSVGNEQPNNYECRYWAEVTFDLSTAKCTDGDAYVQKITVLSVIPDRIFRGSFHTNLNVGTP